jgi:hypothetical protein
MGFGDGRGFYWMMRDPDGTGELWIDVGGDSRASYIFYLR